MLGLANHIFLNCLKLRQTLPKTFPKYLLISLNKYSDRRSNDHTDKLLPLSEFKHYQKSLVI